MIRSQHVVTGFNFATSIGIENELNVTDLPHVYQLICIGAAFNMENLWEGHSQSLTAVVSGGRIVSERYRITTEYVYVDSGVLSTKEEQIPLWALRDIDVKQTMIQKARGVGNVQVRVEANDFTGKSGFVIENIPDFRQLRDLLNEHSRTARDARLRQQQTVSYVGHVPLQTAGAPAPTSAADPVETLTRLGGLLQSGLLTQEEFDEQKAKLLSS